jgi:uncharacterized protein YecT (DUF1311 family)
LTGWPIYRKLLGIVHSLRKRASMKKTSLFAFLLIAAATAHAHQVDGCLDKGSAQEINACAKVEYAKARNQLKDRYQKLLAQIPKRNEDGIPYVAVRKQLKQAQQSWREFIEQDCKTIAIYNTGSALEGIEYYNCMRLHTEQRSSDFERFLRKK